MHEYNGLAQQMSLDMVNSQKLQIQEQPSEHHQAQEQQPQHEDANSWENKSISPMSRFISHTYIRPVEANIILPIVLNDIWIFSSIIIFLNVCYIYFHGVLNYIQCPFLH